MLVVLDRECLVEALTTDPDGLLATLKRVCDQIGVSDNIIEREYGQQAFSNVLLDFEKLEEIRPRAKAIKPGLGRRPGIQMQKHHEDLFLDAIRMSANYLVTHMEWRGYRRSELFERLRSEYSLTILSPAAYVAMRSRNR